MKKAAIAIDSWKLSIFERHLSQYCYKFDNNGMLTDSTIILSVYTDNLEALAIVVKAANDEASKTGVPR